MSDFIASIAEHGWALQQRLQQRDPVFSLPTVEIWRGVNPAGTIAAWLIFQHLKIIDRLPNSPGLWQTGEFSFTLYYVDQTTPEPQVLREETVCLRRQRGEFYSSLEVKDRLRLITDPQWIANQLRVHVAGRGHIYFFEKSEETINPPQPSDLLLLSAT